MQNRGGLTAATSLTQKIFVLTEQMFRRETCNTKNVRKIDTQAMVMKLMKDTEIISIISTITQDADCNDEQSRNVMIKMMCGLYLRVKAFSLAKKITTNYRIEHRAKKSKALRKELKQKCSTIEKEI